MNSDLADDYRLVAMDLRGHGLSEKPREGYTDSRIWADDVNAVIRTLSLDHPILCGWSYGPLVILDYVRHYGEDGISGVNFIGGVTKLGSDAVVEVFPGRDHSTLIDKKLRDRIAREMAARLPPSRRQASRPSLRQGEGRGE